MQQTSTLLSALKEEELDKLTTVLECVRYGLPARETLTYIGGTAK